VARVETTEIELSQGQEGLEPAELGSLHRLHTKGFYERNPGSRRRCSGQRRQGRRKKDWKPQATKLQSGKLEPKDLQRNRTYTTNNRQQVQILDIGHPEYYGQALKSAQT